MWGAQKENEPTSMSKKADDLCNITTSGSRTQVCSMEVLSLLFSTLLCDTNNSRFLLVMYSAGSMEGTNIPHPFCLWFAKDLVVVVTQQVWFCDDSLFELSSKWSCCHFCSWEALFMAWLCSWEVGADCDLHSDSYMIIIRRNVRSPNRVTHKWRFL